MTLLRHLFFGAEDMRVILGEGAHAHQPMQRSRRLVAVDRAKFGEAQRQLAIRAQAVLEDLHMARAVHGFQRIDAQILGLGLVPRGAAHEHALAIPAPMPGDLPQVLVEHLRRVDLLIVGGEAPAHVGDQNLEQSPAFRVPEDRARSFLLGVEQVHLAGELAMIALLSLPELLQIGVKLVFLLVNAVA